jgi:hypothetical protein|nr:MAG TPA: hypothetical protein [Caudoviricetes sp.]
MKASEIIKHELPRLAVELEAKGYLIKTFERSGQINVYLSGQVFIYYVTTGRIVMHKERGFSAFLKLLEEAK